jgi:hypothetical protein
MMGLYPVVAWLLHGEIPAATMQEQGWMPFGALLSLSFWYEAWLTTVNGFIDVPLLAVVVVGLLLGLILFTDSKSHWYKWIAGGLHGISHLAAIFILGWFSFLFSSWLNAVCNITQPTHQNVIWFLCVLIIPALGGYLIGAIIMGLYLFISLHLFGRHDNEAFSALAIEDYKNFLRLHIDGDGVMTVYPFKIDTVPKGDDWEFKEADGEKKGKCNKKIYCTPKDGKGKAELIEKPVKLA